jgi:hypothetical protein
MCMRFAVLPWLIAVSMPAAVHADSGFRCRTGRLVSVGDRMAEVRDRCGEPDLAVQRVEKRRFRYRISNRAGDIDDAYTVEEEIEVVIDEWTYDLGPTSFTRTVIFESARVLDVATGDYGRKQFSYFPIIGAIAGLRASIFHCTGVTQS